MKEIKRGQIWLANFEGIQGSEQGGTRPCLVIQNDVGNKYSPTTIVAIITSRKTKANLPTHHWIESECGLLLRSMVECEQLRTIDKKRLIDFYGELPKWEMTIINEKLKISLGL